MRPKKRLYSIQKEGEKFRRQFGVTNLDRASNERVTKFAKRVKQQVKQQAPVIEVKRWEEKELNGRYHERIRESDVDDYKTNQCLRSTGLKAETEGLIFAAQDQRTGDDHTEIIKTIIAFYEGERFLFESRGRSWAPCEFHGLGRWAPSWTGWLSHLASNSRVQFFSPWNWHVHLF